MSEIGPKRLLTENKGEDIRTAIVGIQQNQSGVINAINNAATQVTAAANTATNAVTNAATYAGNAAASATTASTKASEAAGSASTASAKASEAATSATNAATSANNANAFKVAAQAAQTAAEAAAAEAAEYYFVQLTDQEIINIFEEAGYIIPTEVTDVMVYKGSVATYAELPTTVVPGWVYNVADTGSNYVWTGTAWDDLAGELDYATTSDVDDVVDDTP